MKIVSQYAVGDLCQLEFRLYSLDRTFRWYMAPSLNACGVLPEYDRRRRAMITFNDTYEIDMLIKMLERFKRENIDYIGRWE